MNILKAAMPREVRTITFSQLEVYQAMAEFAARNGRAMPPGTLDRLAFNPQQEPALVMAVRTPGSPIIQKVAFRQAEVAAALILYCRGNRIPLPKNSRRKLESADDGVTLILHLE